MTKEQALTLALEALEQLDGIDTETECVTIDVGSVITAIKESLAQPEQEPVTHQYQSKDGVWRDFISQRHYEATVADGSWPIRALYTSPQRTWVGLTDEDKQNFAAAQHGWEDLLTAAEAKLKQKNT